MSVGDGPAGSPRAALLGDLVESLDALGAWLVSGTGRVLSVSTDAPPELEAAAARYVDLRGTNGIPDDHGPAHSAGFTTLEVTPGLTLVLAHAPRPVTGAERAAMRLTATALAHTRDVGTPDLLTDWLAEQPGPRSVFAVSIDDLDAVTEAFGVQVGDVFLDAVSERVDAWAGRRARTAEIAAARMPPMVLAARTDLDDTDAAQAAAEALRAALARPVALGPDRPGTPALVSRSATVGVAVDALGTTPASELVSCAQRALGAGKAAGGDQVAVFVADKARRRHDRLRLELELEDATHEEQLRLHYQPEYDLRTQQIVAVEALVRWQHPRLGLLSAERFVPGTEHTHAFTAVQRWVIEQTCEQLARWRRADLAPDLALRINAAAAQVLAGTITDALLGARARHRIDTADVCIELTERMLPTDGESLRRLRTVIDEWHGHSIRIAVDDFGTGQGTLSHLLDLPLDVLKLDQTYVRRVAVDPRAHAIVANMVRLAADLGIRTVVAEGVDSVATADTLVALGVHHAQGNFLCPARPAAAITELLTTTKASVSRRQVGSVPPGRTGVVSSGSGVLGTS